MLSILVTGSDTGVGKTHCVGQLAAFFAKQNKQVQIVKPVETGVEPQSQDRDAIKAKDLARYLGADVNLIEAITLNTFALPLAVFTAAKKENRVLNFEVLIAQCLNLPKCDVRIYEGAGGVASPLTEEGEDWADFAERLNLDYVLLVIVDKLGAINQARLSSLALHKSLGNCGIWLNQIGRVEPIVLESNRDGIKNSGLLIHAVNNYDEKLTHFYPSFINSLNNRKNEHESHALISRLTLDLAERDSKKLIRKLKTYDATNEYCNLSDNDYLALSRNKNVINAAQEALAKYGTSASASPLVTGWKSAHALLLKELCFWHQFSTGLLWSSGYAANSAILSTLPQKGDVVIADKLIHNSMIAGIKRSGADFRRYPHLDLNALERILENESSLCLGKTKRTCFVVTESVFSMDGDYPDLKRIAELKNKFSFIWVLDEAHALGWYGKSGAGLAEEAGVASSVDILVGTLGKTLASGGAYCLMHETLFRDYLINHAGEFIYSTSLAPSNVITALAAIDQIRLLVSEQESWRLQSRNLREAIKQAGFKTLSGESPIIPVFLNHEEAALSLGSKLKNEGILVASIRPPTVPSGTSRIRISLKRGISDQQINKLLSIMTQWKLM